MPVTQAVQLLWVIEQVRQGDVHATQTLFRGTDPAVQVVTQLLPSRLRVLHDVQLVVITSHV